MSDRLFSLDEVPEVPIFREPRPVGARGANDQRFRNDYPPDWNLCQTCFGISPHAYVRQAGTGMNICGVRGCSRSIAEHDNWTEPCPDCLGMGSLKARVRLEAGHRCIRCKHPYMPKQDAHMLGLRDGYIYEPSGLHECETCGGGGEVLVKHRSVGPSFPVQGPEICLDCKGTGKVWTQWSACDERCDHKGLIRVGAGPGGWAEIDDRHVVGPTAGMRVLDRVAVEAAWRILTVHHLDGDKANVRWWNLAALCQRCHLEIQAKVVMERVYPFEHSEWFKPYVAAYYAFVYFCGKCGLRRDDPDANHIPEFAAMPGSPVRENGMFPHRPEPLDLTREQTMERLDELLALELVTA